MAEVTDLPTDTTTEHQELKRILTHAINNALGNAAKITALGAILTAADTAADTGATILVDEWPTQTASMVPGLTHTVSRVLSENAIKNTSADNAKLEALFAAAKVILDA